MVTAVAAGAHPQLTIQKRLASKSAYKILAFVGYQKIDKIASSPHTDWITSERRRGNLIWQNKNRQIG